MGSNNVDDALLVAKDWPNSIAVCCCSAASEVVWCDGGGGGGCCCDSCGATDDGGGGGGEVEAPSLMLLAIDVDNASTRSLAGVLDNDLP